MSSHHFAKILFRKAKLLVNKIELRQSGAGFTILELVVASGIIVLLSGIIFANWRNAGADLLLQRSAHKLAQDMRNVAEMAMSAKECEFSICGEPIPYIPPRYGLAFDVDQDYYILFADKNDNGTYNSPSSDSEIKKIALEKGIRIQEIFTSASRSKAYVTFMPPVPLVEIRDPGEARIILRIKLANLNGQTKTVMVNQVGLIEVE